MHRSFVALLLLLLPAVCMATTESSVYPWQLLSGGYNSSVVDGRILAYPFDPTLVGGFFKLKENSIMTMIADNGGWSRSAIADDPGIAVKAGDVWENSGGGRGFTSSFCGGYSAADGCPGSELMGAPQSMGYVMGGPPTTMDAGSGDFVPKDQASTGWPSLLRLMLPFLPPAIRAQMCIAPAGLPDEQANFCAPGLTLRAGDSALYVSPDAGRQWYPVSTSCGFAWTHGPTMVAADMGQPGHIVTYRQHYGTDATLSDASGCTGGPGMCAVRSIAWTGDASNQVYASIAATAKAEPSAGGPANPEPSAGATHAVDAAGLPSSDSDPLGWHYAALGHLALDNGGVCDVAHAGIQAGCTAEVGRMCHASRGTKNDSHERFCPDHDKPQCECKDENSKAINASLCTFPELTSLAIDPRNGQVYAPSNTGLLFSPDGGRKWRRHGHAPFTPWGANAGTSPTTEPWPYTDLPPGGLNELNDPGVKILTMQGLPDSILNALIATVGPEFAALDLNAQPTLLRHMSRISFATQPCPPSIFMPENPFFFDPMGFPRPRVQVVATLAASWVNPLNAEQVLSGVFVAHGDSCHNAGWTPLVFRDTANRMPPSFAGPLTQNTLVADPIAMTADAQWSQDSQKKAISGVGSVVKLPQSQVTIENEPRPCRALYAAATVSPSDPRILHAWSIVVTPNSHPNPMCAGQTGLWRSLDGGASWHIAASRADPQISGNFGLMSRVEMSVSPTDPYRVMVTTRSDSGADIGSTGNKEAVEFFTTDKVVSGAYYDVYGTCTWDARFAPTNPCNPTDLAVTFPLSCSTLSNGIIQCDQLGLTRRRQCLIIPAWHLIGTTTSVAQADTLPGTVDCVACPGAIATASDLPAPPCCLTNRLFADGDLLDGIKSTPTAAASPQCPPGTVDHWQTARVSFGNSGANIECLAAVGSHWFAGGGDSSAMLKTENSFLTAGALGTTEYIAPAGIGAPELGGTLIVAKMQDGPAYQERDATLAAIADAQADATGTEALWRLTNGGSRGQFMQLNWLGDLQNAGAQLLTKGTKQFVFPPIADEIPPGLPGPYPPLGETDFIAFRPFTEAGIGHARLRSGPQVGTDTRRTLIASIPGMGVFILPADAKFRSDFFKPAPSPGPGAGPISTNSFNLVSLHYAAPIPFAAGAWPCVTDMTYDPHGHRVYAAIGRHSSANRCNDFGAPGLYAADLPAQAITVSAIDSTISVPPSLAFQKVSLQPVGAATGAPAAAIAMVNPMALADWPLPGVGSYDGVLLGNFPRSLSPSVDGGADNSQPLKDSLPPKDSAGVWAAVPVIAADGKLSLTMTVRRIAQIGTVHDIVVRPGGGTAVAAAMQVEGIEARSAISSPAFAGLPLVTSSPNEDIAPTAKSDLAIYQKFGNQKPGVYEFVLPTTADLQAPTSGQPTASLDADCNGQSPVSYLQSGAKCQLIAGGTAGNPTTGVSNGGVQWTVLESAPDNLGDLAVGAFGGQGAFILPGLKTFIDKLFGGEQGTFVPQNGIMPPDLQARVIGLDWRAAYAAAYFRNTTTAPLATLANIPSWLSAQLNLSQPGNLYQRVDLPAATYRAGLTSVPTSPGDLTLAFAADEPAESLRWVGTTNAGTFQVGLQPDNPRAALALTRLRVHVASINAPAGMRMLLNGQPLGPDLSRLGGATAFTVLTGGVQVGNNTLTLPCADGRCSGQITDVEGALGALEQASLRGDPGGDTAYAGLGWQGPSSRRHAVWVAVVVADSTRMTRVRLNGSPWRVVQEGDAVATVGGTVYRVLVEARELDHGPDELQFDAAPCPTGNCQGKANVTDAWLLVEYSEDDQICAPTLEKCGDGVDNDCNGQTDELATDLCDGPDADGCSLGRTTCGERPACVESVSVPPLRMPLHELVLPVDVIDLLTTNGAFRIHQTMQFPLISSLRDGADLGDITAMLPDALPANTRLMRMVMHLSADAVGTWGDTTHAGPTETHPVLIRSAAQDDGRTFELSFGDGASLVAGQPLLLMVQPSNLTALDTAFGCPGGTYTYPSEISVVNLCDLQTVNCAADRTASSWCDAAPPTPACMTCTGDWDGCADGVTVALNGGADKCWADTNPNGGGTTDATAITMAVRSATWQFVGGTRMETFSPPVMLDLLRLARMEVGAMDMFMVPVVAGNPLLTGLQLEGSVTASLPGQQAPVPVQLRSGPNEGTETLRLAVDGPQYTGMVGGAPFHVMAVATPGVMYQSIYACTTGAWTMTSWLRVAPPLGQMATGGSLPTTGSPPGTPPPPTTGSPAMPPVAGGAVLTPCGTPDYPVAVNVQLTSVVFCYDDASCQEFSPPPPVTIDLLAALHGGSAFGGLQVPPPAMGSTSQWLASMRIRGTVNGQAFGATSAQTFTSSVMPMFLSSPTGNPPGDGILLNFEPGQRLQVGQALRLNLSPTAIADERVYPCPGGAVQIDAILSVRGAVGP